MEDAVARGVLSVAEDPLLLCDAANVDVILDATNDVDGPFYVFYTPYHLPHLQVLSTISRGALFGDATVTPLGKPVADVLTLGKRDLKAGQTLDCMGGFDYYGQIDNAEVIYHEQLLPVALAQGCRLKRDIAKDQPLTYRDVEIPEDRLCVRLRAEQNEWFFSASNLGDTRIPVRAACA